MDDFKNREWSLPQIPEPYWRDSAPLPSFPKLQENIETDVAIVGAGILGITSAYLLSKQGVKVTVIDSGKILNGTTGHTTAKITAQHGLIYDQLINSVGENQAKLYYEANSEAMNFIRNLVEEHNIDCDLSTEDAYVYTNDDKYIEKIQNEKKAYDRLGIPGEIVDNLPLPIEIKTAIVMRNQGQFHPLKYLTSLIPVITGAGGKIFEDTTAIDIEEGDHPRVLTRDGHAISSNTVIVGSHYPFYDGKGLYFTRLHPDRSYVIAVNTEKDYPGGMYINAEQPTRSLRCTSVNGSEPLVLFGGESHKTGQSHHTLEHYQALESYAAQTFGIKEIPYRWSTQDLITLDKIPYVGEITSGSPNILVGTGFAKWGMTNSTAAALLLTDLIMKKENRFYDLYTPTRFNAKSTVKSAGTFIKENADVAKHFIQGKMENTGITPDILKDDEACVVSINGKRAGAYRDTEGTLHLVDTTCTHMGCEVEWNNGERTWDCPCHGSRFSFTGEVVEGPAVEPLKKVEQE
ncbi:FAD-dependent oxidoreductase [Peribacillus saganii]|uniref:FAD-dependent oxidoreductase n=1 Tax=Peribacillus saganii TaxID=2303992 RepID=A0A372LNG2_9BACI|nr:FAD-dependent oxidoreductase [Peribacillus saganii]RFU69137.1 FAD-dependent oxidoreductase [Peribacillus saganii]